MTFNNPDLDTEIDNGWFFCQSCRTWFPTTGNAPATEDELLDELNEHLVEQHD